jgi:hypothetical protein
MESDPDKPPFFNSWSGAHWFVISWFAVLVALLSLISQVYQ